MVTVPNPGSDEALAMGCTCAIIDNHHGDGFPYGGNTSFWITPTCPIHGAETPTKVLTKILVDGILDTTD